MRLFITIKTFVNGIIFRHPRLNAQEKEKTKHTGGIQINSSANAEGQDPAGSDFRIDREKSPDGPEKNVDILGREKGKSNQNCAHNFRVYSNQPASNFRQTQKPTISPT